MLRIFGQQSRRHASSWYRRPRAGGGEVSGGYEDATVLVLGWAAAKERHVERYTDLYAEKFRIGAHGYTMPMDLLFAYDQAGQAEAAGQLMERVGRENTGKNIIVHCFSNNGPGLYVHLVRHIKQQQKFRLAGCIIDSGCSPLSGFSHVVYHLGGSVGKISPRVVPPMSLPFIYGYFEMTENGLEFGQMLPKTAKLARLWAANWRKYSRDDTWWPGNYLVKNAGDAEESWPMMFLYSTADKLMPHRYVERLVELQRAGNSRRKVFSHNFVTSGHVAHMKHHTEEYVDLVEKFLNHSLKNC